MTSGSISCPAGLTVDHIMCHIHTLVADINVPDGLSLQLQDQLAALDDTRGASLLVKDW